MLTSVHSDSCSAKQQENGMTDLSRYNMSLTAVGQQVKGAIPIVPGLMSSVSAGPLKNIKLEGELTRQSNQVGSNCDMYKQRQQHQAVAGIGFVKPWETFAQQNPSQPLVPFQKVSFLDTTTTRLPGKSMNQQLWEQSQAVYANMPWQARIGRATAPDERPTDFMSGQSVYLSTIQELEKKNRKELDQKRSREAEVREYYRRNPPPLATPYA